MKTRAQIIASEVPAAFWQAEGYQEMIIEGCVFTNGIVKTSGYSEYEIEAMIEEEELIEKMYADWKQREIDELAYANYCAARAAGYAYA